MPISPFYNAFVSDDHRYGFGPERIELFMFAPTYFTKRHSLTG